MLQLSGLTLRIAGRTLIDKASLSLPTGSKVGLVGRNGTGKTTLFRAIAGDIAPDEGEIILPKRARIGRVLQEAPGGPETLLQTVLAADEERTRLLAETKTAKEGGRIGEIHTRLAEIGAHEAEARAARILKGLGFDDEAQNRPCAEFSGGWRMRVALAAVLFSEPDLLLLDEPTNYLDLEGALWLERYIARYRHSAILISHDRDLLNNAVRSIVHLSEAKLTLYAGGYDSFERQRAERQALQAKLKDKQEAQRKHMQAFVDRFRAKASKARQAQSRLKALARLQPVATIADETVLPFRFPEPEKRAAPPIMQLEGVSVGYAPGAPVLKGLDLRIDDDDRIALLGANGNGKSTFAKLISGQLEPETGTLKRSNKLKIGYFAQHQLDELIPGQSAVDHVRARLDGLTEAQLRSRVAQMGLATQKMDTKAKDLSGGEKARLLMGLAALSRPHLLILDEPTNHLDVDSREALIHALNDYSGAVILISHDRHLIEASVDRLWLTANGTVRPYEGDIEEYRREVLEGPARKSGENRAAPAPARRSQADRRKQAAPIRQKMKECERLVEVFSKEIEELDDRLADAALHRGDPERAARYARKRAEKAAMLERLEERWIELGAMLEEIDVEENAV
ncbi:ABC-F family ATP-binding cassette domain-containing protein [Afifella pfennigii]|uniref:ABC-F family ATP-binding cassette domain-containing protein n=1 Tax=Afifella pfennigii TaxID=209897 RepID=UPI00047C6CDC|nr:ABC-F family ATP-binding cassette domain-containing protein [Afifella pfennigii]